MLEPVDGNLSSANNQSDRNSNKSRVKALMGAGAEVELERAEARVPKARAFSKACNIKCQYTKPPGPQVLPGLRKNQKSQ